MNFNSKNNTWNIIRINIVYRINDESFDFEIGLDDYNDTNYIVWQIGSTCEVFNRHRIHLSINSIHGKLNESSFKYIIIVIFDKSEYILYYIEGFCISEDEIYANLP